MLDHYPDEIPKISFFFFLFGDHIFIPDFNLFQKIIYKQLKRPTTDDWIKKLWYMYIMEYYSAIRRDEIPPSVTMWMDVEIIMLSEISLTEKVENLMISLTCGI